MDKLEAIKARHSVRKYLKKEIEQEFKNLDDRGDYGE